MNVLNIVLDFIFVLGLGMGVVGVAFATLISEVTAVLFGAIVIFRAIRTDLKDIRLRMLAELEPLKRMFKVNRDLFLRTVCLLAMTIIFTSKGASMGEVILAANAILLQIHYIIAYLFGGFANASSILVGRSIGSKNRLLYKRAFYLSAQWGFSSAILLSLVILFWGQEAVALFTTIREVQVAANDQLIWMVIFPILGFWGLQLEVKPLVLTLRNPSSQYMVLKMTAPIATPPMETGSGKRPTTAVSTAPSNGVEIPEMTSGMAKYKYSL